MSLAPCSLHSSSILTLVTAMSAWRASGVSRSASGTTRSQETVIASTSAAATACFDGKWKYSAPLLPGPWLSRSFSLLGLDGQTVTVVGYVTNTGDMSVESRLLLDNVQVNVGGGQPQLGMFFRGTSSASPASQD